MWGALQKPGRTLGDPTWRSGTVLLPGLLINGLTAVAVFQFEAHTLWLALFPGPRLIPQTAVVPAPGQGRAGLQAEKGPLHQTAGVARARLSLDPILTAQKEWAAVLRPAKDGGL